MSGSTFLLYQKRDSRLERWDPRAKIIAALLLGICLLLTHDPVAKTGLLALLVLLWGVARLPWTTLLVTLLSLSLFFLSTMIYQTLLIASSDEVYIQFGSLQLARSGLVNGILMCEQIAGIVLLLSLLVRSTSPIELAEGLEMLLKPLKKLKLPVHEAVMMFSITLRFLPILVDEFDKIRKSQLARGGGFHRKGLLSRFGGVFPMLMPLFVMSILRARDLAIAMESRCYQGDSGRTPIRLYRFKAADYTVFAISLLCMIIAIVRR